MLRCLLFTESPNLFIKKCIDTGFVDYICDISKSGKSEFGPSLTSTEAVNKQVRAAKILEVMSINHEYGSTIKKRIEKIVGFAYSKDEFNNDADIMKLVPVLGSLPNSRMHRRSTMAKLKAVDNKRIGDRVSNSIGLNFGRK